MGIELNVFLLVGITETILNFMIGLLVWKGRDFLKEKNTVFKLLIATITTTALMYVVRSSIHNVIVTTLIGVCVYISLFKLLWRANLRYSCVSSILMVYLVMISEMSTVQFMSKFIKSIISNNGFLNAALIWSMPTRLIQIITIIVIYKYNLSLKDNKILSMQWDELSKPEKITIHILLRHLVVSIILNSCYSELFIKHMKNNISVGVPLYLILFCSIYFLISSLQLLLRQSLLEDLKLVFAQGPSKLFKTMLGASNQDQISDYKLQLDNYIKERGKVNEKGI